MNKFLTLITVAILTISLAAGCAGGAKTYSSPEQTIGVAINQEFIIALGSNPTTGYSWQESHDETMVKLVKSEYEMGKEAEEGMVGAGGIEYFRFKALKTGKTDITMVYKRPWEEPTPQDVTKVFTVDIK